jgi:hypothetical protein
VAGGASRAGQPGWACGHTPASPVLPLEASWEWRLSFADKLEGGEWHGDGDTVAGETLGICHPSSSHTQELTTSPTSARVAFQSCVHVHFISTDTVAGETLGICHSVTPSFVSHTNSQLDPQTLWAHFMFI